MYICNFALTFYSDIIAYYCKAILKALESLYTDLVAYE